MPVINHIADSAEDLTKWRRYLHRNPELQYDLPKTVAFVEARLKEFGCDEVVTGIGRSGVVAVIKGQGTGRTVGLRADMDALPVTEITGADYASETPGKMHACGHDGHTTMLLGAARQLAETRSFAGTAVLVFQPAEEGGAGGKAMVQDGLMDRFGIDEIYGMHNLPGLPLGRFAMRPGPIMASADYVEITIDGRGAHAAKPNEGIDVVLAGSAIVMAVQQIVSRNLDPLSSGVVSITNFHAGEADNVLPPQAVLVGTMRSLGAGIRQKLRDRVTEIATTVGAAYGTQVTVKIKEGYPTTINHPTQTAFAHEVASEIVGEMHVDPNAPPLMAAEDFAYMLEERPGAYIFIGNGDTPGLHHPGYDFADAALPYGASYWVRLVERALPLL